MLENANAKDFEELYLDDKMAIDKALQAQPTDVAKRRVISNGYKDELPPYSQSWGVGDIL